MIEIDKGVKIVDSVWFSGNVGETIGIVFVDIEHVGQKAYIGTASGYDQRIDAIQIATRGARFHLASAIRIARHLEKEAP